MIEFNERENCSRGCLIGNLTQEMGGLSDRMSDAANRHYQTWTGLIAECIAEGQQAGEIRSDLSAVELADYLHNSFNGALLRSKAGHNSRPMHIFYKLAFEFIKN